jgi:RimJ/RimL family protein N-acetyltransferase
VREDGAVTDVPELRTARILLRAWRGEDLEPFAAMNADPEVLEHFPSGSMTRAESDALVERFAARWRDDGHAPWAVERLEDGAFLGFIGLATAHFDAHFTPAVEVGWRLGRDAWGHGYATEGGSASLRWGFEALGLAEIVSFTTPANTRSRAVMERLAMTRDPADDFDHPRIPVGHPLRRHVLYRLRRRDWQGQARRSRVTSRSDGAPSSGSAMASSARRMSIAFSTPARPPEASAQ